MTFFDETIFRVVPRVYRQFKMYNDPAYRVSRGEGKA